MWYFVRRLLAGVSILGILTSWAYAAVSEKDVLVMGRVIGLLKEAPKGMVTLAIAEAGAATQDDVETISTIIGNGKKIGEMTLVAVPLRVDQIDNSSAKIIYIPAGMTSTQLAQIFAYAELHKMITISTNDACLKSRKCAIFIASEPAVDIRISVAASAATGVTFGSTFRMIIKEVD